MSSKGTYLIHLPIPRYINESRLLSELQATAPSVTRCHALCPAPPDAIGVSIVLVEPPPPPEKARIEAAVAAHSATYDPAARRVVLRATLAARDLTPDEIQEALRLLL